MARVATKGSLTGLDLLIILDVRFTLSITLIHALDIGILAKVRSKIWSKDKPPRRETPRYLVPRFHRPFRLPFGHAALVHSINNTPP